MATDRITRHHPLLEDVVSNRRWGDAPLFLLDVGSSGGIERHWFAFGDLLRAVGFEPLVSETERLNHGVHGTNVRYEAAFVTCRDYDRLFPPSLRNDRVRSRSNDAFPRTSASRAQELLEMNYAEHVFNAGTAAVYADRSVVLDEFIPLEQHADVDFIKIDTDGHDVEVLLGTEQMLLGGGVLGFSVEAQFQGANHPAANTFANIDGFLRGHGFSLFDLEVYRYSRTALPAPFMHDLPAQTTSGQVLWGEAVYFRDLGDPEYERKWPFRMTPERVLKLAALHELFGVPDCAAELLLVRGGFLDDATRQRLLDLLTPPSEAGEPAGYAHYIAAFENDATSFYPSRRRPSARRRDTPRPRGGEPLQQPRADAAADEHLGSLKARLAELRTRRRTAD